MKMCNLHSNFEKKIAVSPPHETSQNSFSRYLLINSDHACKAPGFAHWTLSAAAKCSVIVFVCGSVPDHNVSASVTRTPHLKNKQIQRRLTPTQGHQAPMHSNPICVNYSNGIFFFSRIFERAQNESTICRSVFRLALANIPLATRKIENACAFTAFLVAGPVHF